MYREPYLDINALANRLEYDRDLNYHEVLASLRSVDWSGDVVRAEIMGYIIRASKKDCRVTLWEQIDEHTSFKRATYKDLYRGGTFDDIYPMPWGGIYD